MSDYTHEEKVHLGRFLPGDLFNKLVVTIRDAIIGCPKFADKVIEVMKKPLDKIAFDHGRLKDAWMRGCEHDGKVTQEIKQLQEQSFSLEKVRANAKVVLQRSLKDRAGEDFNSAKKIIEIVFGPLEAKKIIKEAEGSYAASLSKGDTRDIKTSPKKT
jgi:hypothetical protein